MAEVRDLIEKARRRPEPRTELDLFVDDALTIDGTVVDHAIGTAVLADALLSEGMFPRGFTETESGRTYHYSSEL